MPLTILGFLIHNNLGILKTYVLNSRIDNKIVLIYVHKVHTNQISLPNVYCYCCFNEGFLYASDVKEIQYKIFKNFIIG